MPACLTHSCFAQVVKDQKGDAFAIDPCAYAWGAQGPDFFFCHRFLPFQKGESLQAYGNRLHEELPSKVLGALRDFLRKHSGKVYRSYVEGFVFHYALDSTAHPYINWKARELVRRFPWETPDTLHGEIEAALDAIVLRYETGKLPSEVRLKDMFPKNEVGYMQLDRQEAELLFRLISERYEHGSIILTSNKYFSDWGELLSDNILATALLDRLLHHAHVVNIRGQTYRLRERWKAGVQPVPPAELPADN